MRREAARQGLSYGDSTCDSALSRDTTDPREEPVSRGSVAHGDPKRLVQTRAREVADEDSRFAESGCDCAGAEPRRRRRKHEIRVRRRNRPSKRTKLFARARALADHRVNDQTMMRIILDGGDRPRDGTPIDWV